MAPLTARAQRWAACGERVEALGREIHVFRRDGVSPPLLFLHGFPSSSYDWRLLLDAIPDRAVLAFDFLGFGLSDKPRDHGYSLMWQADLTEELVERFVGEPAVLVAHDMGTSVATELFARELEGGGRTALTGALLFNGSILLERAHPTRGQQLLRSPAGAVAAALMNGPFFRRQLGSVFSQGHPLDREEADDQWSLVSHRGGRRISHRLVSYMDERITHAERWHGAFRDWPRPLSLLWGMRDPVAGPAVLEGLRELRPAAPVTELADAGHYPQIECPAEVASVIEHSVRPS